MLRQGLRSLVEDYSHLQVVVEASTGVEAIDAAPQLSDRYQHAPDERHRGYQAHQGRVSYDGRDRTARARGAAHCEGDDRGRDLCVSDERIRRRGVIPRNRKCNEEHGKEGLIRILIKC